MKSLFFILFSTLSLILFSADMKFVKSIEEFNFMQYKEELKTLRRNQNSINVDGILWIKKNKILLKGSPFYFVIDTDLGTSKREYNIEEKIGLKFPTAANTIKSDFVVFRSGNVFDLKYFIYSFDHGFKPLNSEETTNEELWAPHRIINSKNSEKYNWEYILLGNHKVVPWPKFSDAENVIYESYEYAISLLEQGSDYLVSLPADYYAVRNEGSSKLTSVSFDRFRVAIFSDAIIKEEKDFGDWKKIETALLVFNVEYDGNVEYDNILKERPDFSSSDLGLLEKNTEVIVTDADNYEVDSSKREDFWYYVKSNTLSGWIYGADLIIEDEDWKDRLRSRGRPLEWDQITDDGDFISKPDQFVDDVEDSNVIQEKKPLKTSIEEDLKAETEEEKTIRLENEAIEKEILKSREIGLKKDKIRNQILYSLCILVVIIFIIILIKRVVKKEE